MAVMIIQKGHFKQSIFQLFIIFVQMQNMQKELEHAFGLVSRQNNQSIKEGQALLNKLKSNLDYPILLLSYLKDSITYEGKLRAAIELRIWCDKYKNIQQFQRAAYQNIIQDVKGNTVFAFLSFSDKIQQTLLPAIVSLTAIEFPDKWQPLIPGLLTYVKQNPGSTLKVIDLMVEITNKYSYSSRSDALYSEIILVCNQFQKFFLELTNITVSNIITSQNDQAQLKLLQQQMVLFYNLNYQDLHPEFQDNLPQWMDILNRVMKLPINNENFFKCKGAALQSILLYASKYREDVEDSIKGFMSQIWELCANSSSDPEYDDIVTNALKYFKGLLTWQDMKQNFASNLQNLISHLILPNLSLTNQYTDMFQEDIETFISYFFRNSQTNSRRASALELLQSIVRNFNPNFRDFIRGQVTSFQKGNLNMEALLLTLVIESAPKGFRDIDGVTSLWIDQDLIIICYEQLIKDTLNTIYQKCQQNPKKSIQKQINIVQLLTTLRFIFYFRIYLPTEELNLILKLCCGMYCSNQSLRQIIIMVVNAIVSIKYGNFILYSNITHHYTDQKLKEVAADVFSMIAIYDKQTQQLNASLNKLLYSTIKLLKAENQQFYDTFIGPLIKSMLCKTANFIFTSVLPLFEAIGYLAYYLSAIKSPKCSDLEVTTHQYFHQTIKIQSDMLNFSFQIISIFLRFCPGDVKFYESIYNSIIRSQNWTEQNLSLISSYLQYISAFITLNNKKIVDDKQAYEQILTKLITLDHYELFFRLLRCILKLTNVQGFFNYGYMHILVKGAQFISSKSLQGRKMSLVFLFQITFEYDTQLIIKGLNSVDNGFFEKLLLNSQDIIQTMQVLRNRKLMFGSICGAILLRCFSSVETDALMISLLVENTIGRFRRENFISTLGENPATKKESTYQKLQVFKEIDSVDRSINFQQEQALIQAYKFSLGNNPNLNNFINDKNLQRLKKLYQKYQNQQNR